MSNSERFWDRIAKNYDQRVNEGDEDGRQIIELSQNYLNPNSRVLDFACATGKFSFELAGLVGEIYGIDISSEMITIAKQIAKSQNLTNVHFSRATLEDTIYAAKSFDVIFAFNILHLLEEPQNGLQQLHQLLNPDGILLSATACMGKSSSFLGFILKPLSKLGLVPHINFFQPADVTNLISDLNFKILETKMVSASPANIFIAAQKS